MSILHLYAGICLGLLLGISLQLRDIKNKMEVKNPPSKREQKNAKIVLIACFVTLIMIALIIGGANN